MYERTISLSVSPYAWSEAIKIEVKDHRLKKNIEYEISTLVNEDQDVCVLHLMLLEI